MSTGDDTRNHDIKVFNFTRKYLIIVYIYYYHTYIMQISIYVINNMPEPGRNLAADACVGRTQLSPCIISVLGHSYHHFKLYFQKVDQDTGGNWLINGTKHRKDNHLQSLELHCRISYM